MRGLGGGVRYAEAGMPLTEVKDEWNLDKEMRGWGRDSEEGMGPGKVSYKPQGSAYPSPKH